MLGGAVVVGALAFLTGLLVLVGLADLPAAPRRRLFEINAALGSAIVMMSLGGMLAYQAASSLGKVGSSAMRVPNWVYLAPILTGAFPVLVVIGQNQVNEPERLPWLFPATNLAIVTMPSLVVAFVAAQRYSAFNLWAWPVSWREWSSGIIYGAIGATTIGGIINTLYLVIAALILIETVGNGDNDNLARALTDLPTGWGIAFDISVLSVVAPLNEEFWKGSLVALFFFRKGGAGRCFLWGVLAGAGFNILETFQNSIAIVNPAQISAQQLSEDWWKFATARVGTGAIHSASTGLAAVGFYGLLRGKPRYLIGYPLGALIHGSWNFMTYTLSGDAILSQAGPDSRVLDIVSVAGMVALFLASIAIIWEMPRRLRDNAPAPVYRMLRMAPGGAREPGAGSG